MQLLCEPILGGGLKIQGDTNGCHEMRRTAPRLHRLAELLNENPLCESNIRNVLFTENDKEDSRALKRSRKTESEIETRLGFSFNELLSRIQASEGELRKGLLDIHAVELSSRWWILRGEFIAKVLESVLIAITLIDSKEEDILLTEICNNVSKEMFPHEIVRHVACMHGTLTRDGTSIRLDGAKVASRIAIQLLESNSMSCAAVTLLYIANNIPPSFITPQPISVFNLEPCKIQSSSRDLPLTGAPVASFLKEWQAIVDRIWPPQYLTNPAPIVNLDLIQSFVLIETDPTSKSQSILHFPKERLHYDAAKRFKQLFSIRPRWTSKDITPFIEPICSVEVKMNELLLAHSRMTVQSDKSSVFSSK